MKRNKINIPDHTLPLKSTVKDALDAINMLSASIPLLFVTDGKGKLCGTVSDGDIRRGILNGAKLGSGVDEVMNRNFTAVEKGENPYPVIARGKRRNLHIIPITRNGEIEELLDVDSIRALLPMDAVLMAGGKGERLRPLTIDTPKPLLKVGGVPIIERNIQNLESFGIDNIFVTVNYLHHKIESFFENRNGSDPDSNVKCVLETRKLGTLGSLSLVKGLKHDNVLVMNSDLLTNVDFERMWQHHVNSGAAITIGAVPYTVSVPYAILNTKGTRVLGLQEKPTFNYFANGGVYIMKRELIKHIPENEYLDAPDFIASLIEKGKRIEYFPIKGSWIDIGSPDDYRAANALMDKQ